LIPLELVEFCEQIYPTIQETRCLASGIDCLKVVLGTGSSSIIQTRYLNVGLPAGRRKYFEYPLFDHICWGSTRNMSQPRTAALKPPQPGMFPAGAVPSWGSALEIFSGSWLAVPSWDAPKATPARNLQLGTEFLITDVVVPCLRVFESNW